MFNAVVKLCHIRNYDTIILRWNPTWSSQLVSLIRDRIEHIRHLFILFLKQNCACCVSSKIIKQNQVRLYSIIIIWCFYDINYLSVYLVLIKYPKYPSNSHLKKNYETYAYHLIWCIIQYSTKSDTAKLREWVVGTPHWAILIVVLCIQLANYLVWGLGLCAHISINIIIKM